VPPSEIMSPLERPRFMYWYLFTPCALYVPNVAKEEYEISVRRKYETMNIDDRPTDRPTTDRPQLDDSIVSGSINYFQIIEGVSCRSVVKLELDR